MKDGSCSNPISVSIHVFILSLFPVISISASTSSLSSSVPTPASATTPPPLASLSPAPTSGATSPVSAASTPLPPLYCSLRSKVINHHDIIIGVPRMFPLLKRTLSRNAQSHYAGRGVSKAHSWGRMRGEIVWNGAHVWRKPGGRGAHKGLRGRGHGADG